MLAAIYHHFKRHHYHSVWCPHREHSDPELANIYKYRDVVEDLALFEAMINLHNTYMSGD